MDLHRVTDSPLLLRDCDVHHDLEVVSITQQIRSVTLGLALEFPAELSCVNVEVHVATCLVEKVGELDDDLNIFEDSIEFGGESCSVLRE